MKKTLKTILSLYMLGSTAALSAQTWPWASQSTGVADVYGSDVAADHIGNNYMIGTYQSHSAAFGSTTLTLSGGEDVYLAKTNSSGAFLWAVKAGPALTGISVATDGSNVFITGSYNGTMTFYSTNGTTASITSAGGTDAFIAKYNTSGVVQWAVTYGGTGNDGSYDINLGSSLQRIYVTGNGVSGVFTACYNYSGVQQWSRVSSSSGASLEGRGVVADAAGNAYMIENYTGSTGDPVIFSAYTPTTYISGQSGILMVKFNNAGAVQWVHDIGNTATGLVKEATSIGIDGSSNVYISGDYTGATSISGISLTNAGSGSRDVFVAKYNSSGNVQWAKRLGGTWNETISGLCTDGTGNTFIACQNYEDNDVSVACQVFSSHINVYDQKLFVVKYDNSGNVAWAAAPTINNDLTFSHGITTAGDGYAVLTGDLNGPGQFGSNSLNGTPLDAMIVKVIGNPWSPVISNVTVCAGSHFMLAPSAPGGDLTFNWYTSRTAPNPIYTGDSYGAAAVTTTTYYVSTQYPNHCESDRVPVIVYVLPSVTLNVSPASQTICSGGCASVNFTASPNSVQLYQSGDGGGIYIGTYTQSPVSVCPTVTTVYSLTIPGDDTHCGGSVTFTIVVDSPPAISSDFGLIVTHPAGSATLAITATVASVPAGSSFLWNVAEIDNPVSGNEIPGTAMPNPGNWWDPSLYYSNSFPGYCCNSTPTLGYGTFYVGHYYRITRGTWWNGPCQEYTSTSQVVYICNGCRIAEGGSEVEVSYVDYDMPMPQGTVMGLSTANTNVNPSMKWELYPNPANGVFHLKLETLSGSDEVIVCDYTGKQIEQIKITSLETRLDLSKFAKGIYFVRLSAQGASATKKLILE